MFPKNGRWNLINKKLVDPFKLEKWVVVNFSARCDVSGLVQNLIKCGEIMGIHIDAPFDVIEESAQYRQYPPLVRVELMVEDVMSRLPGRLKFVSVCFRRRRTARYMVCVNCVIFTAFIQLYDTNESRWSVYFPCST